MGSGWKGKGKAEEREGGILHASQERKFHGEKRGIFSPLLSSRLKGENDALTPSRWVNKICFLYGCSPGWDRLVGDSLDPGSCSLPLSPLENVLERCPQDTDLPSIGRGEPWPESCVPRLAAQWSCSPGVASLHPGTLRPLQVTGWRPQQTGCWHPTAPPRPHLFPSSQEVTLETKSCRGWLGGSWGEAGL